MFLICRYKQQVQANAKQEKEQLRRALELSNKEKEMYKNDRENLKKDNLKIRKAMQELVNQNYMLKKQIQMLEQQEEIHNDEKSDGTKEELEYQIKKLTQDLTNEINKNKKWERFSNDLKVSKNKSETETRNIKEDLSKLQQKINELQTQNTLLVREKDSSHSRILKYQEEVNNLRASQVSQPIPTSLAKEVSQESQSKSRDDYVNTFYEEDPTSLEVENSQTQQTSAQDNHEFDIQFNEEVKEDFPFEQEESRESRERELFGAPPTNEKQHNPSMTKTKQNIHNPPPKRVEKPVISSSLFEGDDQRPSEFSMTSQEYEHQLEEPQPIKNKLMSHPAPQMETHGTIPDSNLKRNISHNFGGPSSNDAFMAEDFFNNLSQMSNPKTSEPVNSPIAPPSTQAKKQKEVNMAAPSHPTPPQTSAAGPAPGLELDIPTTAPVQQVAQPPQARATPRTAAKRVIPKSLFG